MTSFIPWCLSLSEDNRSDSMSVPVILNCKLIQPTDDQLRYFNSFLNPHSNHPDYRQFSKNFIENYASHSASGIVYISHFYDDSSMISLHINKESGNMLFELVGYNSFKNKLIELGIHNIKYNNLIDLSQPPSNNTLPIVINGMAEINGRNYGISSTMNISSKNGNLVIINHLINIQIWNSITRFIIIN